jgi:WD40 repeat protein
LSGIKVYKLGDEAENEVYILGRTRGQMIATGNEGGTVQLWSLGTRKVLAILSGHRQKVNCVAFSPDGKTLASAGFFDGTVRLWDIGTRNARAILEEKRTSPQVA